MDKMIIYTDGSSKGNPGPGGYAAIIVDEKNVIEIGGHEPLTTNNRMEMTAAIEALKKTPEGAQIEIHTDSEYLMKGATIWIKNWQKNNWRTKDRKDVLNRDLWEIIFEETEKRNVAWQKVLGHSGHIFNERCDEIAQDLADRKNIKLFNGLKQDYKMFH